MASKKPRIRVKCGNPKKPIHSDNLQRPEMSEGQQRSLIAILKGFNLKRLP